MKHILSLLIALCCTMPVWAADDERDSEGQVVFYLRGEHIGGGWNSCESSHRFSREGNVYTLHLDALTSGEFKIGSTEWNYNFGATAGSDAKVNESCVRIGTPAGPNFTTSGITDVTISFTYTGMNATPITFTVSGDPIQPGTSGSLPVLYINVTDDAGNLNNEIIDRNLSHKNYFNGTYWLDMNGCTWLEELGGKNVGSKEEPLPLEIKARGNYTRTGFSKKPFKLKLGKKQSLLGLSKSKHFAILAHADDNKGYLRNFTGFNLGRRMELPWTPWQQPVEVVINGDYRGLYFLTESIRIGDDRVMIEELDDNCQDASLASGGYLVELDNYDEPDESQIRMAELGNGPGPKDALRITFDTPEVYSPVMRRFITEQFTTMNSLVGSNSDDLWAYIDMDDLARYYLVEEIISHTEAFHGSTYMFRDRGEGQKWHFSPLWDCGNAFNGSTSGHFYIGSPFGNTWIPSIMMNDTFRRKVKETWMWFMANKFDGLYNDINEYAANIKKAAAADRVRWADAPLPDSGNASPVADNTDMDRRRNEVKAHLGAKIEWMKQQFGDYTTTVTPEPARDTTAPAPLPDYVAGAIEDISAGSAVDAPAPVEYYNPQGIRLSKPAPGTLHIEKRGTQAVKRF